jgi:cytochrome oxidase assembly protein ShyY1
MAFLQPHTANITPHPAPVAPLADPTTVADRGDGWLYRRVTLKNVYIDARARG